MKTQKEIEKKRWELDKMMGDNMPTEETIKKLREFTEGKKLPDEQLEMMLIVMGRSTNSISIDAQRFILDWVLDDSNNG